MKTKLIPSSKFVVGDSADSNRVFLWENHNSPPFIRPVKGWKVIGYGKAPWPGGTDGFAAMLEKVTPAEEKENMFAPAHVRFDEGTRIWQHINKRHLIAIEEWQKE